METETCNVRLVKVDTDNLDELIKLTVCIVSFKMF